MEEKELFKKREDAYRLIQLTNDVIEISGINIPKPKKTKGVMEQRGIKPLPEDIRELNGFTSKFKIIVGERKISDKFTEEEIINFYNIANEKALKYLNLARSNKPTETIPFLNKYKEIIEN